MASEYENRKILERCYYDVVNVTRVKIRVPPRNSASNLAEQGVLADEHGHAAR